MGCDETMKLLPLIDFSNLRKETPTWESVKKQVREALEEYGCFEAKFEEISLDLQKSLIHAIHQLFDLPLQTKLRNTYDNNKHYQGYIGQHPMVPLYESLGIQDALSPEKIDTFVNLLWPQGNPTFSKIVERYAEQLHELDITVRRMVVESLGLEKYMDEHMDSTNYVVRFQKYDGPGSGHESKLGLAPHTDGGIITILYQNHVNGLQLQTKHGNWITAQPTPNSFIVMIGQSFHAWTNGRLHCPYHKVMMSGDEDRFSVGLFSSPKSGYIIKAPAEIVDDDHPLLYKPFDHSLFIDFAYSEAGLSSKAVLKDYCGI